jgi:uncharacterized repeat protein (TIGR03803 family)
MSRTMSPTIRILGCTLASLFAISALLTAQSSGAPTEKLLYSFSGSSDGGGPSAALIFDRAGNLYGTTSVDGTYGFGTVFKLTLSGGVWSETVLHSFAGYPTDGEYPEASLVFDTSGNLYGTTNRGGSSGDGTVFELTPSGDSWNETVLYSFACCSGDAFEPVAGVYLDASGNIYGTTLWGGTGGGADGCDNEGMGCGAFFELTHSSSGWTETVPYSFNGAPDAALPYGNLIRDKAGNFYGTSIWGGNGSYAGSVFALSPTADGGWTDRILYTNGDSETGEQGGMAADDQGNLYGTGVSSVFELTLSTGWMEATLYSFTGGLDGNNAQSGVVVDKSSALYGTTFWGGGGGVGNCADNGCGTVFKLQKSDGEWQKSTVYRFRNEANGQGPTGVVLDSAGNIYGTTVGGGANGHGTVYEITQ